MTRILPRRLHAMAVADLRERTRRPAFIVTLVVALWASSVFTPPGGAPYATLQIGGHRGVYNSAWVGAATAMLCSLFLSFAGFYLVRSAVEHDRRTGVGAILASTPMRRVEYTLAKWLGNLGVLVAMVAVMVVGSAAMQIARGEDLRLDPLALAAPFAWGTVPAMAVVAGLAVLFETVPGLRSGMGNAAFFVLWTLVLGASHGGPGAAGLDPLGVNGTIGAMRVACAAAYPDVLRHPEATSLGLNFREGGWHLTTFRWAGMPWTAGLIVPRLAWLAAGVALAALAALPFDRFESAGAPDRRRGAGEASSDLALGAAPAPAAPPAHVALPPVRAGAALPGLVVAELRLLLQGLPIAWFAVMLALVVASALVPRAAAARVAAVAWVWPVLRWSALGARDLRHGTAALLLSSPRPIPRQLAAAWLAGFALALAAGAGLGIRATLGGDLATVAGALAGAAFVPALALGLGSWTGSSKAFEVLYLVIWYAGPLNGIPFLDFTGGSGGRASAGFAVAAAALIALAGLARRRQLRG
jgi:hypothetical protein